MRIGLIGAGAVGVRAARQLAATEAVEEVVFADRDSDGLADLIESPGGGAVVGSGDTHDVDAVVLATPAGTHAAMARSFLTRGVPVVSVSDSLSDVRQLLALHAEAIERRVTVVAGAAFSPGYTCVLARHAASRLDQVEEIHVARHGAGGPACAREYHRTLGIGGIDWRDGAWLNRAGGTGRELVWFPDPVGALDCYRAGLAEPLLLVPAFSGLRRVTARRAARRRDRFTSRLPMLRPPPTEGGLGALRVEVRGQLAGEFQTVVFGAVDHPAVAAGAVAAWASVLAAGGELPPGARGLASLVDPLAFLTNLAERGVRAAVFEGLPI